MDTALASEINALSHQVERITERNRRYRDFTLNSVTDALRNTLLYLGIYRTYITEAAVVSDRDRDFIKAAVKAARANHRTIPRALFDFIEDTLLLNNLQDFAEDDRQAVLDAVMKIQQVSSPIMAKSVEDTTFYVFNRLVSLNEVGGHPEQIGIPVSAFHTQNQERLREWRHSMLSSSTHDTKRAEDTRARINVLSEIPAEWEAVLQSWTALNATARTQVDGRTLPDSNDEYLMYQIMIGALPFGDVTPEAVGDFRERIAAYMAKAVQEAKVHTSWLNPSETYLNAVDLFVRGVLADGDNPFLAGFVPFQRRVAYFAQFNSLSQLLLKLTSPGVPDIYQGTELWDFSLVDPDNRRPVDYGLRRHLIDQLNERAGEPGVLADELLAASEDGRIKLYVMHRVLMLRRDQPDLFAHGDYAPLEVHGAKWNHVVAYARRDENHSVLTVVPRLMVGLTGGEQRPPLGEDVWTDTWMSVPDDASSAVYRNLYTGEVLTPVEREGVAALNLKDVLARFPVALLVGEPTVVDDSDARAIRGSASPDAEASG
jgi:(1->4)-alpha-D-glucan 1-alpha-D-glucosylmutase